MELGDILPIEIPTFNVESKLGYLFVNSIIQSGPILSYRLINELYLLDSIKPLKWPFYLQANNFQRNDIVNLNNKSLSGILSIDCSEDNYVSVVYYSNDSLFYSKCRYFDNQITVKETQVIKQDYERDNLNYIASQNGLYFYDANLNIFRYRRYNNILTLE
jgi:hypothetical protein